MYQETDKKICLEISRQIFLSVFVIYKHNLKKVLKNSMTSYILVLKSGTNIT